MAKFLGLILLVFGALIIYGSWIVKSENGNNSILFIPGLVLGGLIFLIGLGLFFSRKKN